MLFTGLRYAAGLKRDFAAIGHQGPFGSRNGIADTSALVQSLHRCGRITDAVHRSRKELFLYFASKLMPKEAPPLGVNDDQSIRIDEAGLRDGCRVTKVQKQ